jgi:hypothetical protein
MPSKIRTRGRWGAEYLSRVIRPMLNSSRSRCCTLAGQITLDNGWAMWQVTLLRLHSGWANLNITWPLAELPQPPLALTATLIDSPIM